MKEITLANVVLVLLRGVKATVEITIDPVIEGLEILAERSENTIDDTFVIKFREFKEAIIGFILAHTNDIARRA